MAGATALASCSTSKPSNSGASQTGGAGGTAAKQPKKGGVFARYYNGVIFDTTLDPHPAPPVRTGYLTVMYEPLLRRDTEKYQIEPGIAQKFEQPSQTDYVFHLQPGVKFQNKPPVNGRELTADDVVFNIKRIGTKEPRFVNRLLFDSVDKVEAVDKSTVKVTTKQPDVTTLTAMTCFSLGMLAPEVVAKANKFATPEEAVGTGPFVLESFDETSATFTANKDYWRPGLPYVSGLKYFNFNSDQKTAWGAFLSNQILLTWPLGPDTKQQSKDYAISWFPDASIAMLQPNVRRKPFNDARVTRALRLMVDHDDAVKSLAEVWWGRGLVSSYLTPLVLDWDFTEQEYRSKFLEYQSPKDSAVKEAMSLLSAAGYTKDNPLKFEFLSNAASGFGKLFIEVLQAQWRKASQGTVDPGIKTVDFAQSLSLRAQGQFDYVAGYVGPSEVFDPDSCFRTMQITGAGRNYGGVSDPKLDQMVDKQRTIFDAGQRKAAIKEIITYMMDNSPNGGFANFYNPNAVRNTLQGFPPETYEVIWGYAFDKVWLNT